MPLPYTPDRELDPPENTEVEKEKCEACLRLFEPKELRLHMNNLNSHLVCKECLENLQNDTNLKIK